MGKDILFRKKMMLVDLIRSTTAEVMKKAKHVTIVPEKIGEIISLLEQEESIAAFFDFECHIDKSESQEAITNYMFVLDALNFCFWPDAWEYDTLALVLKNIYKQNPDHLKPEFLANVGFEEFKSLFFAGHENFVQIEERHRVVNELGYKTVKYFDGDFSNVLKKANFEADELLEILSSTYLLFQDHCIYEGRQVFFYKRAQILIGDLKQAFKEKECDFQIKNIDRCTCFADYRVPQILAEKGVLKYSDELMKVIDGKVVLDYGCGMEVELRAAMIQAVEMISERLQGTEKLKLNSVEVDWFLWQVGEKMKDDIVGHHRVYSIFY